MSHCRRTSTSVDEETVEVKRLVLSDRRLTVHIAAEAVGVSANSVHSILSENMMMKRCLQDECSECFLKADGVNASARSLNQFNNNSDKFLS